MAIEQQNGITKPSSSDAKRSTVPTAIDLEALRFLPPAGKERQRWEEKIGAAITLNLRATLSPADQALLKTPSWKGEDTLAAARITVRLDQAILDRAPSLGPHLFLSPLVLDRLSLWCESEPNGPELFVKLGKALKRGALARQGKGKLPVQAWMSTFKVAAQQELKTLQQHLKTAVLPRQNRWTEQSLNLELASIVGRADRPFPVLLHHWQSFMKLPANLIGKFSFGQISPAMLTDEWIARSLNRDPEAVRQELSTIRTRRRSAKRK